MTIVPFTHHEILGLVDPFARRGLRVDLAKSDRLARRLAFIPRDHVAESASVGTVRESLELDNATPKHFRLTRTLALGDRLRALLSIEGDEPAALLAAIESIPPARQLRSGRGFVMALSHRIEAAGVLALVHGSAEAGGLTIVLTMPPRGSRRADVALTARVDDPVELPDDLLAVLGWDWSRLDRRTERGASRWTGSVGLKRAADADAERMLESAASHVARTLSEAPVRFHERLRAARWRFAFRRAIPVLVCIALLAGTFVFAKAGVSDESVMRMLVFNAPPLLLVAFFCLRDVPRIELPRAPRRLDAVAWRPDVRGSTRDDAPILSSRAVAASDDPAVQR